MHLPVDLLTQICFVEFLCKHGWLMVIKRFVAGAFAFQHLVQATMNSLIFEIKEFNQGSSSI